MNAHSILDDLDAAMRAELPAPPPAADVLKDLRAVMSEITLPSAAMVAPVQRREQPAEEDGPRPSLRAMLAELEKAQPDRAPWPEGWLDHHDSADGYRCRALWGEVLRFSLADICLEASKRHRRRNVGPPTTFGWLGTRDFRMVCDLAGLDAAAIEQRVRPMLATPEAARDLHLAIFPRSRPWSPARQR